MTNTTGTNNEEATPKVVLRRASEFTVDELVSAYNQTRADYIVPMLMNARHLNEYIHNYDVKLEYSAVAMSDGQILGLSMLGVRPGHCWCTRLGILPAKRRHGTGEALMRDHIKMARALGVAYLTLDVIKNNVPARQLFKKLGFQEQRVLLVLRRPPGPPKLDDVAPYDVTFLDACEAVKLLRQRRSQPSWLDETPSLVNAGDLSALRVTLQNGSWGWLVYQNTISQLGRLVLQTEAGDPRDVARALVHALHREHPIKDTKTENVPIDAPHLPGLMAMGYLESFRRIEMRLDLGEKLEIRNEK